MAYYVYIVECADGTLYTGITTDVERRMAEHNAGTGAKYTKTRTPVHPVYVEECEDRSSASRREYAIKRLSRRQKEELVAAGPASVGIEGLAVDEACAEVEIGRAHV